MKPSFHDQGGLYGPGQALLGISRPTCFQEWRYFLLTLECEAAAA